MGCVFGLGAEVAMFVKKTYGLTGTTRYSIVAGIFVLSLVYYWITRTYQKRKGIDLTYAFLEVPPGVIV